MSQTHDQNFKNLILDYPIQAIEFFAPQEAKQFDGVVKVTPLRQEQLKEKLGDRYRELDTPPLCWSGLKVIKKHLYSYWKKKV